MNDLPKALEASVLGAETGEQIGHERAALLAHFGVSLVCFDMGDWDRCAKHVARMKELIERIGTRRFMARALHQEGRLQLAVGRSEEAADLFRKAMEISRETGIGYCGPLILGTLARAVDAPSERKAIMKEAEHLLAQGCVAHNYFEFYLDAMEVSFAEGDWDRLEHYASALESYTSIEPMPRTDFFILRGRTLALSAQTDRSENVVQDLSRLRGQAKSVGLNCAIPALETAISR